MWEAKVFAAADAAAAAADAVTDAAETNWKHKVTPDRDLIYPYVHFIPITYIAHPHAVMKKRLVSMVPCGM